MNEMKRLKIQKFLAMITCLLLCATVVGASADTVWESPPVNVDEPEHAAAENSKTFPPAPDQGAADAGTGTPGEEVREEGEQTIPPTPNQDAVDAGTGTPDEEVRDEEEQTIPPTPNQDAVDAETGLPGEEVRGEEEQTVEEDQAAEDVPEAVFHTVLFVGPDNAILETRQVEDGECVDEPRNPAAPQGYAFAYWYDDAGNGQPFEFYIPIACDMKLRAKFIESTVEQDDGDAADGEAGPVSDEDAEPAPDESELEAVLPGEDAESTPEEGELDFELSEEEQAVIISGPPRVEVEYAFEGGVLLEGARVTLTARVFNVPEDAALTFQWQNDVTGRFEDVSGATEQTYTFYAGADNSGCRWRVRVEG